MPLQVGSTFPVPRNWFRGSARARLMKKRSHAGASSTQHVINLVSEDEEDASPTRPPVQKKGKAPALSALTSAKLAEEKSAKADKEAEEAKESRRVAMAKLANLQDSVDKLNQASWMSRGLDADISLGSPRSFPPTKMFGGLSRTDRRNAAFRIKCHVQVFG